MQGWKGRCGMQLGGVSEGGVQWAEPCGEMRQWYGSDSRPAYTGSTLAHCRDRGQVNPVLIGSPAQPCTHIPVQIGMHCKVLHGNELGLKCLSGRDPNGRVKVQHQR